MKLSQEDKDALLSIIENGHWSVILKVAAIATNNHLIRLRNAKLEDGPRDLFSRKAQYDGARSAEQMFISLPDQLRKQER